jgi:hypothetical protein
MIDELGTSTPPTPTARCKLYVGVPAEDVTLLECEKEMARR